MKKKSSILCLISVLMFGLTGSGIVGAALPEGLVFLMTFDEGKGDTIHDLSGFGNDGSVEGKADWIDGKLGSAFYLDASTQITGERQVGRFTRPASTIRSYSIE